MPSHTYTASDLPLSLPDFKLKALAWADTHKLAAYYTSNHIVYPYQGFSEFLGVSNQPPIAFNTDDAFSDLRLKLRKQQEVWCGYLAYDLKNQVEQLSSHNPDFLGFPLLFLFEPEVIFYFQADSIVISSSVLSVNNVLADILASPTPAPGIQAPVHMQQRVSKARYKEQVEQIRQHIVEGDVYELNFCVEFYAAGIQLQPLPLYLALSAASPTPFGGYLKYEDRYLLCASPERFLKKEGDKLISQPIKGTIRRGATPEEDAQLQHQLRHDEKELAENMMIVDLVRNDLRRSCATGTIQVEEMFGIYGFKQVSQMISTITGTLRHGNDLVDALIGAFPMGSMTGAPKIRAMQLIEELESTRRGLYSGAFGYITPDQDCDFNVVIRSLQYNATTGYLSFMVGSAITFDSDPEQEYQECLLKAKAMLQVLHAEEL